MATQTQTSTQNGQAQPPELSAITRVVSIPLVASSLDQLRATLSSNVLTRTPYQLAESVSKSAISYSQPLQRSLAPWLARADGFANKGLDVVESRYPYPFKATPEDVVKLVQEGRESSYKSFDQRVRTPAVEVAQGIDQRFAPIVNYFEDIVNKTNNGDSPASSPTSDASQYQFQRAYALSMHLRDNVYVYSHEHLKQLQEQNVFVQRAMESAQLIQTLASAGYANAQTRINALSDNILTELSKLQHSTAQLPQTLQASIPDVSTTVTRFRDMITAPDVPLNEKANHIGSEVRERVNPMLERLAQRIGELVHVLGVKKEEAKEAAAQQLQQRSANGNAAQ